jgi:hypothetical protein
MDTLPLQNTGKMPTEQDMASALVPLLDDPQQILKLLALQPAQNDQRNLSQVSLMFARTLGIQGDDERIAISDLDGTFPIQAAARDAAYGVALLASADAIAFSDDDVRLIAGRDDLRGPFQDEPCVALTHPATAFLVTDTHAVTAAHAVAFRNPRSLHLAFGFGTRSVLAEDRSYYSLRKSHVVGVKQIVALVLDPQLGDIAVLELTDAVPPEVATPLRLAPAHSTKMLQEVAMISHARAQPLKAVVRHKNSPQPWRYPRVLDQDERFIYTNLDSFEGCSGSPVIDAHGRVVGVQVRGELEKDNENVPIPYPEDAAGSTATRISLIRDTMAALGKPLPLG